MFWPKYQNHIAVEGLLLVVLATLWGASYTFLKVGVATIPPITLIAARTLIASALLLAIMRYREIALPRDFMTWRRLMVQALINSVIPFTLIASGEKTVDAGLATILNSTSPIFTFFLTWGLTRHEPVTPLKLFGAVAGMTGICLVVGVQALGGIGGDVIAQLAIILATVCYAGAAIFGKNFSGLNPMVPAAGSMLCGGAILAPLSLLIDRPWTLTPSAESIGALLGLSVFSTALAFVIYFRLVNTLGSVGATSQAYLRVPIGVAIGAAALGETLASRVWIGLICVVVGVAAMVVPLPNLKRQKSSGRAAIRL
jgi:drug/metabolite transporter (DMT)-like permease